MQKLICWLAMLLLAALSATVNTGCSAKAKKAYHLERANRYFAAGQYDQAEVEYMNVLRSDRENAQAIGRLGTIYFEEGRLQKAAPYLFKGSELATNDLDLRLKLGSFYLAAGKAKEARAEANFVLARRPQDERAPLLLVASAESPKVLEETRQRLQALSQKADDAALEVALGSIALHAQDLKTAESNFKRAQTLNPKLSAAWSALGALYLAQTNLTQAEAAFKTAAELAPDRSEEKLRYAQFKALNGDLAASKSLLQGMIKKTPDYIPPLIVLANIAVAEVKYADCAALLNKALARDPDNFEAQLLDGQVKLAQGKVAEATSGLERMAKNYPQAPRVHYQLAVAYLAGNDADKASRSLNRAIALDSDFFQATLLKAGLQIRTGYPDLAVAALQRLIQKSPQILQAQLLLAGAYRAQSNFNKAFAIYRDLEAAYPDSFQIPLLMGETFLQQKNAGAARAAFTKSLGLSPDNFTIVEQLVGLDLAEKQYAAAFQRIQPLLEKNPKLVAPLLLKAQILFVQGDPGQAEAVLLKAVELQPDAEAAHMMLARIYMDAKQNQKALAQLQIAATVNTNDVAPLFITGMILDEEKDYDGARDAYEKLLARNPNYSPALNNLAYLYSENRVNLDRAYELAQRARNLLPADPAAADTLGWIHFKRAQYASALNLLQESANKLPNESEVQFHLGMTYYMMGQADLAQLAFQRALQSGKDFHGKDECDQCLAVLAVDVKSAKADAVARLQKRVAAQPDDFIARLRLALIYQRDGKLDEAMAAYESVLKADPKNMTALINLTQLYAINPENTQKALELAKAAYKLAPDNAEVAKLFGRLAYETGDYKLSLNLLQEVVRNESSNEQVLFDFARSSYAMGRVADAQTAMRNLLKSGNHFSRTNEVMRFLRLTVLADDSSQAVLAADQVAGILKTEPDYVPALMVLGRISEQKDDLGRAKQAYSKVLDQYPDFIPAQKRFTIVCSQLAVNDPRASEIATKARAAFPDDLEVDKAFGVILFLQGDYIRAERQLKETAVVNNTDPEILYYLGMAQYNLKKSAECKKNLQKALSLNLPTRFLQKTRRILTELK